MCNPGCGTMMLGLKDQEKDPRVVDKSSPKVLLISRREMQRFKEMTDPGKRERELAQYYRAYGKYVKQGSLQIENQWHDSINKRATRTLEIRRHDLELRNQQAQERKKKLDDARVKHRMEMVSAAERFIAMQAPGPKELRSASIECYTKAEQDAQIKFKQAREADAKEKYDKEVAAMWADVEAYKREQKENAERMRQKTQSCIDHIVEQIEAVEKHRKDEYLTTYNNGIKDRELAEAEYQALLKDERNTKKARIAELIKNTEESAKKMAQRLEDQEKFETTENKLNEIIHCSQQRIGREINQRRKDLINDRMDVINTIAEKTMLAAASDRDAVEDALVARLTKEKADREDAKAEAQRQKKQADQKRANEDHDKCLADMAQEENNAFQLLVWNKLNSSKSLEINEEYKRRNINRQKMKSEKRIAELVAQMKVDEAARERKRKHDEDFNQKLELKYNQDDETFFNYSNQLTEELSKQNYIIRPVQSIIHKYKVDNRIYIKEQNAAKRAKEAAKANQGAAQGSSTPGTSGQVPQGSAPGSSGCKYG